MYISSLNDDIDMYVYFDIIFDQEIISSLNIPIYALYSIKNMEYKQHN